MRTFNRLVGLLLLSVVSASVAFADTIKQKITLTKDAVVNGTVVKKGTYVATFDDQTNELSITKGKDVIAKAPARLEQRSGREPVFLVFRQEGEQSVLLTVSFKKSQATILDETKATVAR